VSTFLTAGNVKLMLLHTGKSEDAVRNFFQDVYELYVKVRTCKTQQQRGTVLWRCLLNNVMQY